MGVSGVGKTTVGRRLAARLGWAFFDADDLHSPENVAKMQRGEGLTDADREPWLQSARSLIEQRLAAHTPAVLACSALKAAYRTQLCGDHARIAVAWLDAPPEVLTERLATRRGHFAGPSLLASQRTALEPPSQSEAVPIRAEGDVEAVVSDVIAALSLKGAPV